MRRQVAVYWRPTGSDRSGQPTYASPIEIPCRWEDVSEQFMTAQQETSLSNAKVYPDRELALTGLLRKGALASTPTATRSAPLNKPGVYEIRKIGGLPNLRNTETLYEVWL